MFDFEIVSHTPAPCVNLTARGPREKDDTKMFSVDRRLIGDNSRTKTHTSYHGRSVPTKTDRAVVIVVARRTRIEVTISPVLTLLEICVRPSSSRDGPEKANGVFPEITFIAAFVPHDIVRE